MPRATALIVIVVAAALAGCAPRSIEAQRAIDDDLNCRGYGITPVDPGYAQCRTVFAQQRQTQQRNAMNALVMHGAYLADQAPPEANSAGTAVGVLPPQLTNCWPAAAGWTCYTQRN
jgi:hypothetical protein